MIARKKARLPRVCQRGAAVRHGAQQNSGCTRSRCFLAGSAQAGFAVWQDSGFQPADESMPAAAGLAAGGRMPRRTLRRAIATRRCRPARAGTTPPVRFLRPRHDYGVGAAGSGSLEQPKAILPSRGRPCAGFCSCISLPVCYNRTIQTKIRS